MSGSLTMRADVIKKTILRSFRQFWRNEFKSFFDFPRHRRRCKLNPDTIFVEADKFVKQKFSGNIPDSLAVMLVALVDTKKKHCHVNEAFPVVRDLVLEASKRFSVEKMNNLLNHPEVCLLMLSFLQCPVYQISRNKSDPKVLRAYSTEIDHLRILCNKACKGLQMSVHLEPTIN